MSGDVLAYLAEHAPTIALVVIAAWTAWQVSKWKAKADAAIRETRQALDDHEEGCAERWKASDAKLDRIDRAVARIEGQLEVKS